MLSISYQTLKRYALLFTACPLLFFFFGWLNVPAAFLTSALLIAMVYFAIRSQTDEDGEQNTLTISRGVFITVVLVAFLWCFLGGQGGFVHQTGDHAIRNEIMVDLTLREWPVTYYGGENLLCYYIAYWMVPCTIGKIFWFITGNAVLAMHVCNIVLLLWSTFGVVLTLLLVLMLTHTNGKYYPILAIVMFIFFSGMDTIGVAIGDEATKAVTLQQDHLEWWGLYFQYSSNTTLLYWVYNQTIPVWPLMLCMINERHLKDFAMLGALAFPYGPFPFVGMVIFGLMRAGICFVTAGKQGTAREELRLMLSPQNFLSIAAIIPVFALYFTANSMVMGEGGTAVLSAAGDSAAGSGTGFRLMDPLTSGDSVLIGKVIRKYLLFILLEFGIWVIILLCKKVNTPLTIGVAVYLLLTPLFQLGSKGDFGMRSSIPGIFYLCIMMIRLVVSEMPEKGEIRSLDDFARKRTALLVSALVLAIGAATPVCEITREILQTVEMAVPDPKIEELGMFQTFDYDNMGTLDNEPQDGNFFARNYQESLYYKILSKH